GSSRWEGRDREEVRLANRAFLDDALTAASLLALQRGLRSRERSGPRRADSRLGEERGSAEQQGTPPITAVEKNGTVGAALPGIGREGDGPLELGEQQPEFGAGSDPGVRSPTADGAGPPSRVGRSRRGGHFRRTVGGGDPSR